MKKQKKQKLLNIWNKVKKPLIILSFVGNIIFLLFIIVGCVGVKKKSTQAKADDIVYVDDRILTLRNSKWELKEDIDVSSLVDQTTALYKYGIYYLHFSIDDEPFSSSDGNLYELYFTDVVARDIKGLTIHEEVDGSSQQYVWFTSDRGHITWNYSRVITIYSDRPSYAINTPKQDYESKLLIDWFFDNAELIDAPRSEFKFLDNFNYNAVESVSNSSYFVPKGWNTTDDEYIYTLRYGFISSGKVWTNIRLHFFKADNARYMKEGEILTNQGTGSAFYSYMDFYNLDTGESVKVNVRSHGDVDGSSYLLNGSTWTNTGWQYVFIFENRDGVDNLTRFNTSVVNYNGFNDYEPSGNYDAGVGRVFNLFTNAFKTLIPIFSIPILPGITIGLLFFIPLIVIIIIVVIKLVKK